MYNKIRTNSNSEKYHYLSKKSLTFRDLANINQNGKLTRQECYKKLFVQQSILWYSPDLPIEGEPRQIFNKNIDLYESRSYRNSRPCMTTG